MLSGRDAELRDRNDLNPDDDIPADARQVTWADGLVRMADPWGHPIGPPEADPPPAGRPPDGVPPPFTPPLGERLTADTFTWN